MIDRLLNFTKSGKIIREGKANSLTDFSFLGVDIHSHLLPGIDDGPKDIEESITLVKELKNLGFDALITTPHVRRDQYPNSHTAIAEKLNELKKALVGAEVDISIRAAAEYYIDDNFVELLNSEPLLTIHGNHVMVEFSLLFEPPKLKDVLRDMVAKGYSPVIAHAERYFFYHKNLDQYKALKDIGCLLQLNLISLTGYYNRQVKFVAESILKNKLYDYCGSNVHHSKHIEVMKKVLRPEYIRQIYNYPFLNSGIVI